MPSVAIGAKLRQERVAKGLAIDDISRDTRIAPRFLEAIETDDYSSLPGLVFTRNFVRQYALILEIDPDPLLAELPKPDETQAPLPDPPAHPRPKSSYHRDRRIRSLVTSLAWLTLLAGVGLGGYLLFSHSVHGVSAAPRNTVQATSPPAATHVVVTSAAPANQPAPKTRFASPAPPRPATASAAARVRVSLTAREESWVRLEADGKTIFVGTLKPDETREVSAAGQVNVLTGNAGGVTISLNGKTLDSLGPSGQVREVRLTAEGPQRLSKGPPPASASDQL